MKRTARKRRQQRPHRRASGVPETPDPPMAIGIRDLHRAVVARPLDTSAAHTLRAFADALSTLETDYRRLSASDRGAAPEPVPVAQPRVAVTAAPMCRAILKLAELAAGDVVYVTGAGDGAVASAAAKHRGVQVFVIDDDQEALDRARLRARRAGVERRLRFVRSEFFARDVRRASVVMLLGSDTADASMARQLLDWLKPGTRIVSATVDLGDWAARQSRPGGQRPVRCWVVPPRRR